MLLIEIVGYLFVLIMAECGLADGAKKLRKSFKWYLG